MSFQDKVSNLGQQATQQIFLQILALTYSIKMKVIPLHFYFGILQQISIMVNCSLYTFLYFLLFFHIFHKKFQVPGTEPYKAILGVGLPLHKPYIQLI